MLCTQKLKNMKKICKKNPLILDKKKIKELKKITKYIKYVNKEYN